MQYKTSDPSTEQGMIGDSQGKAAGSVLSFVFFYEL